MPAARELMAGMGVAAEAEGRTRAGTVLAARAPGLAIVLVCGAHALPGLARHDLRLVLGDLGALAGPATSTQTVPRALVERLLAAVPSGSGS